MGVETISSNVNAHKSCWIDFILIDMFIVIGLEKNELR